jgi:predicted nucleic acid-binding protein
MAGSLFVCQVGQLEQLYSARAYDALHAGLRESFEIVAAPPDLLDRALSLQRDLTLHHGLGVVHCDGDFERIAEVRPLVVRRLA